MNLPELRRRYAESNGEPPSWGSPAWLRYLYEHAFEEGHRAGLNAAMRAGARLAEKRRRGDAVRFAQALRNYFKKGA